VTSSENESLLALSGQSAPVDRFLAELDKLLAARDQTALLLRAIAEIGSDHDLDSTLRHVVAKGLELTGCSYGALTTCDSDGKVTSFVHAGMPVHRVSRIDGPPTGKGLLKLVLEQALPVRLDDLTTHPAAVGFPESYPQMRAFLGVPIVIRGNVFGGLYLTDDRPNWVFDESDEIAIHVFASAAAVAIDNAQLFEHSQRRAEWMKASREIVTELLSGSDSTRRPLRLIAEQVQKLADAEQTIVLTPLNADEPPSDIDTLMVSAAVGVHADEVVGQEVPVDGSTTGHVFRSGAPLITEAFRYPILAFTDAGERSAIVMPLLYEGVVRGIIAVARSADQIPFDDSYLDLVGDFAGQAALALALATNSENARELSVLADRERIAHDLHDYVIQRLFAVGLDVQGTIARAHSPDIVARLNRTIDDLQNTIENIRTTIFELQSSTTRGGGFRKSIQDAVAALTENRDIVTTLHMSGPMIAVGRELAQQAEAAVVESVSNAVRHSGATHLNIEVVVADELSIDVTDDGCGIPADNQRQSGLANLRRRAEQVGGTCRVTSAPTGGTVVHWTAPLIDL
jgi:signal transduction histidine kinase